MTKKADPSESDIKREIVKDMQKHGGYARRIEDQYAVGTYDMIIIPFGLPVFMAEVKKIAVDTFRPTGRQFVELMRIQSVAQVGEPPHAIPVVIGWQEGIYYFHHNAETILRQNCFTANDAGLSFADQIVQYYNHLRGK